MRASGKLCKYSCNHKLLALKLNGFTKNIVGTKIFDCRRSVENYIIGMVKCGACISFEKWYSEYVKESRVDKRYTPLLISLVAINRDHAAGKVHSRDGLNSFDVVFNQRLYQVRRLCASNTIDSTL